MKSQAELLRQLQDENVALIRENIRLRAGRKKLKHAFARYVNLNFIASKQTVGVLDYRCREVIQMPPEQVTDKMVRAV